MKAASRRSDAALEVAGWGVLSLVVVANAILLSAYLQDDFVKSPLVMVLVYHLPLACTLATTLLLFRRSNRGIERTFWGAISLSFGSLLCAELYWLWYSITIDPDGPTLTHPILLLYGASCASFIWLIVGLTKPSLATPWRHARVLLDIATGAWAVVALVYIFWTFPLLGDAHNSTAFDAFVAAVYPTVALFLLGTLVGYSVIGLKRGWRPWEYIFALAVCVFCTALVLFPIWRASTIATQGPVPLWYTSLLGIGFVLLAVGGTYRLADGPAGNHVLSEKGVLPEGGPHWASLLYQFAVTLVLVVVGWKVLTTAQSIYGMVLVILAVVLATLLAARSCLAAIEAAAYHRSAHTDPVTGAMIRSDFIVALSDAVTVARDTRSAISLVMMDIAAVERFDAVLGHSLDDGQLKQVLAVASRELEPCDGPYLLGYYRFAFLLSGKSADAAATKALKAWREIVRSAPGVGQASDIAFGVAGYPEVGTGADELLAGAHTATDDARAAEGAPVVVHAPDTGAGDAQQRTDRIRLRAFREAVRGLAHAVDARDSATAGHSTKVCDLASVLAQVVGLSDSDVQIVALAATVHDVGKVGMAQETDGASRDLGYRAPDSHPLLGESIFAPAHVKEVLPMIRHHHERWDGGGFPDGLTGDQIPIGARILAICDAFVNLTTERADETPPSVEEALNAIEAESGSAFDPAVVGVFARMLRGLGLRSAPTVAP